MPSTKLFSTALLIALLTIFAAPSNSNAARFQKERTALQLAPRHPSMLERRDLPLIQPNYLFIQPNYSFIDHLDIKLNIKCTYKLNDLRRNNFDFSLRFFSGLSSGIRGAVHLVGSFVPLRGVASFMADIGVPGAITLLELLTPTSGVGLTRTSYTALSFSFPFGC